MTMERYQLKMNGLLTASTFSEKEAQNIRNRVQEYFTNTIEIVPAATEITPQLQIIDGGKGK